MKSFCVYESSRLLFTLAYIGNVPFLSFVSENKVLFIVRLGPIVK